MKKLLLIVLLTIAQISFAQKGEVKGKLSDKEMGGESLPFANVLIKGTTIGSTTDMDGNYTLSVPAGQQTVVFSFVGYETIEKTVTVIADQTVTVNAEMGSSGGEQLEEVIITGSTSKETESALLVEQKKAVSIETKIGAQELSKKGVSNASAAVAKTAGVVKGGNSKNVVVRGLGDRYNSTSLNGIPLPSEDPEYKNISLEFFETSIIKNIAVNKVFTSSINGDVAGANVDISSKELTKSKIFNLGFSVGANSQTLFQDGFLRIDGANNFGTNNPNIPNQDLSVYNFDSSLKPNSQSVQPNAGISAAYGKKFEIGEDKTLKMFLVGDYGSSYNYTEGFQQQTNSVGVINQNLDFQKYNYKVSQLLMGNFKLNMGNNNISFNSLFIHSNNQTIGDYSGFNTPEEDGDQVFIRRQNIVDNILFSNQILADFSLSEKSNLEVKLGLNTVKGDEPDRITNNYLFRDGFYSPSSSSPGDNERYFSELVENDYNALAKYTLDLAKDENEFLSSLEVGGDFRYTTRIFEATIFNHDFGQRFNIDIDNPDDLFTTNSIENGIFDIETARGNASNPRVFDPFIYQGERLIMSGYGNLTHQFSEEFLFNFGLRADHVEIVTSYDTNIASSNDDGLASIEKLFILPSLSLKYNLNEDNILRFAASKTYTLPQFKEIAPFRNQGVSFATQGNKNLTYSDNYNFDLKYEHYLSRGELISLTGFYKLINNPIIRTELPSAGSTLTFLNLGHDLNGNVINNTNTNAHIFGIELEARKNIIDTYEDIDNGVSLDFGVNISYLNSQIKLDDVNIFGNNTESQLEGATPIIINTDLAFKKTFLNESELQTTLVFNYFGDRVYSIGTGGFENIIEKGIPTLDLVSSYKISKNYSLKFKANNILNPKFQLNREGSSTGDITLSEYRKGTDLSLSFNINF